METDIKPIDLGHDDVDGQECKDGRSRTWMVLLYEDDSTHKAVLDGRLAELDWNFAGCKHDMDEGVKEHHHIVILFKDGRKNTDIAADLGIDKRWLRAWDRQKKALRYLCHRDHPHKYQYSTDGIYGTIAEKAVSACSKGNELSEVDSVKAVLKMLDEIEGAVTYRFFLKLVADAGYYAVFRRMGNLATRLIDEHNGRIEFAYRQAVSEHRVEERRRMVDEFNNRTFADKVPTMERLEKKGCEPLPLE